MVIAIDGPAASGKSTVAERVARELGIPVLDSGAMYRSVALLWLQSPERAPAELARAARIELGERVLLDGRDVSEAIRAPDVSQAASRLAADPEVRAALVDKQRQLLARGDWVAEGRDIGTVVAPHAELKVFLTATPEVRADRRARELGADPGAILAEQAQRDARDSERQHSPLRPAAGAITLDTSDLGVEEVVARVLGRARGILAS
jgi:cytidylate kinase